MICQRCHQNTATVHVTEITEPSHAQQAEPNLGSQDTAPGGEAPGLGAPETYVVQEEHLCPVCAQGLDLPGQAPTDPKPKSVVEIWKLLQLSRRRSKREGGQACPSCEMTLLEFRQKGRLGCPQCYEAFRPHLEELLERIHGASAHSGRGPGIDDEELDRMQRKNDLERDLDEAVAREAYEDAARIRDELEQL